MNELIEPVHTLFTEACYPTRASIRDPERPAQVTLWYNSQFWTVPVDSEEHYRFQASPIRIFKLNQLRQYHLIDFDWSRYKGRYPGGNIPVRDKFIQWAKGGKYERIVALFYSVQTPSGVTSDRVLAVAAYDLYTYNCLKHALVEAYLDWSLTDRLPFTSPDEWFI